MKGFKYIQFIQIVYFLRGFSGGSVVKNPAGNAGDTRNAGSMPGLGRSLGGGHSDTLQYSCLENPMDRGAWQPTVHGVRVRHD